MLKLRPHHLQCIKYFVGHGYSLKFTKNMKAVIKRLNENEEFTLIQEKDDICSSCPFFVDGQCRSIEKVRRFDKAILESLQLEEEKTYHYPEIAEKLKTMNLLSCCSDCSWQHLCQKIDHKQTKGAKD